MELARGAGRTRVFFLAMNPISLAGSWCPSGRGWIVVESEQERDQRRHVLPAGCVLEIVVVADARDRQGLGGELLVPSGYRDHRRPVAGDHASTLRAQDEGL